MRKVIVFLFLLSQLAQARDVFFMGSAVSNATGDFALRNCNSAPAIVGTNLFYTCTMGSLRCRLEVLNASPSTQNVSIDLNFNLQTPQTTAGVKSFETNSTLSTGYNPIVDRANNILPHGLLIAPVAEPAGASNPGQKGCNGWCSYLGPSNNLTFRDEAASPQPTATVPAGQLYIMEKKIHLQYFAVVPATDPANPGVPSGPVAEFFPIHPNAKIFGLCSGRITANDAAGQTPGFVVANGTLDYIADSYQNPVIDYGGWTDNDASTGKGAVLVGLAMACRAHAASAHWAKDIAPDGRAIGNASLHAHSWGRADCVSAANASCVANYIFHNKKQFVGNVQNNTAIYPQHISSVPITVNGGAPF